MKGNILAFLVFGAVLALVLAWAAGRATCPPCATSDARLDARERDSLTAVAAVALADRDREVAIADSLRRMLDSAARPVDTVYYRLGIDIMRVASVGAVRDTLLAR